MDHEQRADGDAESLRSPANGPREPAGTAGGEAEEPRGRGRAGAGMDLATLAALFDDPSPTVWRAVQSELGGRGKGARTVLERMVRRGSPRARARARRLLLDASRVRAARRLAAYALGGDVLLERGLFLLARFGYPDLDARPHLAALDALGAELLRRTEPMPPTIDRALCVARYLGQELGFCGTEEDYDHPDHVFVHRAIETKRGLPLTLAAIYQAVARRAGIRAHLVGLPGHVVLRLWGSDRGALVDPFRGGVELSERDCLAYLAGRGLTFQSRWFQDASDAEMLERQVRNLAASYRRRGLVREIGLLARVLFVLQSRRRAAVEVAP